MNLSYFYSVNRHFFLAGCIGFCALFALMAYAQALHYPFIFDDVDYIANNTRLAELPWTQVWRLLLEPYNDMAEFLPLRDFSYWFDLHVFGSMPMVFRLHNLILYALCLPLVYLVSANVWRYFHPADTLSAPHIAAWVTVLFALHPAHAEAVVWIAARKDLLTTLFSLLAIWLTIQARREQGLSTPYAIAALLALLAAMLSKATAVAVAPVMAIIWLAFWRDIEPLKRSRSMLLWPLASVLLAASIAVIFASIITSKVPLYFGSEAVTRSLAILGWLARLSLSPESRHFFYPVFEDVYFPWMVGFGALILCAVCAVLLLRKRCLSSFAMVSFTLLCLPSLQIIPYAAPSLISDRFIALAVWPMMLLLVALIWRLPKWPRSALLLMILFAWAYQSVQRPRDWQSFEGLIDAELRAHPGLYIPATYKIFGFQLHRFEYNEAVETAKRIAPIAFRDDMLAMIEADYQLRVEMIKTGQPEAAMQQLWSLGVALKHKPPQAQWNSPVNNFLDMRRDLLGLEWQFLTEHFPKDATVRYYAGLWALDANNFLIAQENLRAASESGNLPLALRATAYKSLAMALIGTGDIAAAEQPLRLALADTQADQKGYCLLSWIYKQTQRKAEAARAQLSCH